jgi:hypothetical protein
MRATGGSSIGSVTWFTIEDGADVRMEDFRKWHAELELDTQFIPPNSRGADNFRVATTQLKGRSYELGNGKFGVLDLVEGISDRRILTRRITRYLSDEPRRRRSVPAEELVDVGTLIYNRPARTMYANIPGTDSVEYELADGLKRDERKVLDELISGTLRRVGKLEEYVHPAAIRNSVRSLILAGDSIILERGKGIYWSAGEDLDRIAELVARIGNGDLMAVVPLPDTPTQRAVLQVRLNEQVVSDADSIRAQLADARLKARGAPLSQARQVTYRGAYLELVARTQRLTKLTRVKLTVATVENVNQLKEELGDMLDPSGPARKR